MVEEKNECKEKDWKEDTWLWTKKKLRVGKVSEKEEEKNKIKEEEGCDQRKKKETHFPRSWEENKA